MKVYSFHDFSTVPGQFFHSADNVKWRIRVYIYYMYYIQMYSLFAILTWISLIKPKSQNLLGQTPTKRTNELHMKGQLSQSVYSIQPHHLQTLWRFGSGLDSDNLSSNRDQPDQEIEVARHWEEQSKDDSKQPSPFHARVKVQRLSFQPHKVTDAVPFLHQNCVFFVTKSTQTQLVNSEHLNRLNRLRGLPIQSFY